VVVNESIASFSFSSVLVVIRHHSFFLILVMLGVMLIRRIYDWDLLQLLRQLQQEKPYDTSTST
jgi:hypothetical protein